MTVVTPDEAPMVKVLGLEIGTVLDYDTNLVSKGFTFNNPNAACAEPGWTQRKDGILDDVRLYSEGLFLQQLVQLLTGAHRALHQLRPLPGGVLATDRATWEREGSPLVTRLRTPR